MSDGASVHVSKTSGHCLALHDTAAEDYSCQRPRQPHRGGHSKKVKLELLCRRLPCCSGSVMFLHLRIEGARVTVGFCFSWEGLTFFDVSVL